MDLENLGVEQMQNLADKLIEWLTFMPLLQNLWVENSES